MIPDHWKIIENEDEYIFCDDGRDFLKPMFIRKDGLARIYFNEGENEYTGNLFAVSFDSNGDGACCGTLDEAILYCDNYCAKYIKANERNICQHEI